MTKDNSTKQVSRLTGALLARKGTAAPSSATLSLHQPAINRFATSAVTPEEDAETHAPVASQAPIEKMSNAAPAKKQKSSPEKTGAVKSAVKQQALVSTRAEAGEQTAPHKPKFTRPEAEINGQKRIAMTLRMEEDSHLKLRLFSAHSRKSCQVILSEALELYFEEMGDSIPQQNSATQQR